MTIYGLAEMMHEGGGHGDPGANGLVIRPMGAYMSGDYPPLFTTREAAEEYIARALNVPHLTIIELELRSV